MPGLQDLDEIAQGVAAVENVLHHDDVLALDGVAEILDDVHLTGGHGARAVGGYGHKIHPAEAVDAPGQIGHEDVRAPQDADQQRLLSGVVGADLPAQFLNSGLQLFFGNEYLLNVLFHGVHSILSLVSIIWISL